MKITDSHCHVISQDTTRYPGSPLGGTPSVWARDRPITAEQLLDQMDVAGVAQAVLVQATTAYGYNNGYVLESAAQWPDRFIAVGTFEPLEPDPAGRLRAAVDAGLAGVRLFTTDGAPGSDQGLWFAAEQADAFWEAATQEQVPVCLQLRLNPQTSAALEQLLKRHPDVVLLLDHCGYPDVRGPLADAAAQVVPFASHPGVNLKLTHRTLEGLRERGDEARDFLRPVLDAFSSGRIAWGSNVPAAEQSLPELVTLATEVLGVVTDEEREDVLHRTAERLYPALAKA